DVGHTVDVKVTATNAAGSASATSVRTATVIASGGGGGGCDLNAAPSNFSSRVSAARAGQTICLATGHYGTWTGTNKAITVKAASGAAPTMTDNFGWPATGFVLDRMRGMSGTINGSSNITIQNSTFPQRQNVEGNAKGIVFTADHFPAFVGEVRLYHGL